MSDGWQGDFLLDPATAILCELAAELGIDNEFSKRSGEFL
jgi:hypothetical protein